MWKMIAFCSAVTSQDKYERFALPGCRLAAEADSVLIAAPNEGSTLSQGYNGILDQLAERDELEAVVLLHQDLEIRNPDFVEVVRGCLADPEVAIIGAAGAPRVRGLDWWEPGPVIGDFEWAYQRDGGGTVAKDNWTNFVEVTGVHPVAAVDGMILVSRAGRRETCASTRRSTHPRTATTSTSASRPPRRASRSSSRASG